MSSSRRVAMTSAMAGCRAPCFGGGLRNCRFGEAVAPRVAEFCRSVLLAAIANLAIPQRFEIHAPDMCDSPGASHAGFAIVTRVPHREASALDNANYCCLQSFI